MTGHNGPAMNTPLIDSNRILPPSLQLGQHAHYQIAFLRSVFLLAALVAFGMGFYRWQFSPLMGAIDIGFSVISMGMLYYLKLHKDKVGLISNIAIVLCFFLFLSVYLLAPYNQTRLSLFFLFSAATFYLKGRVIGLRWLILLLIVIPAVNWLPGIQTGYSGIDIVTTCMYLIALFFIFWNYEAVREAQYRREREQSLQSLIDARWREALEGVGDAVWEWDMQARVFHYSKSYAEMLGYSEAELGNRPWSLVRLLHPEDKLPAIAKLKTYLAGALGEQYISEQRLLCRDGCYKWILCRGRVTGRDSLGRPQRMLGTHVDITENKRVQEEILRSRQALKNERELFQTMLDNAPLGIWMVDAAGVVQFVNRVFCNATGISEAQFLAASHYAELLPAAITSNCIKSDKECMSQGTPHFSTEWIPFVDGRDHLLEITKVRLLNHDGAIRGVIGLAADITERREHEKQLEHIAHYDALTGVPNRVLLADRLAQSLARAKRDKGMLAVCYLDLDGFKQINDAYGHEAGDKVLIEVTRRIKEVIREDDTVARLGGDEFVVLLVGIQAPEECVGSLNRLLEVIHQPIDVHEAGPSVSVSIGVALYPEDNQDADTLLRHADQAMYVAKQAGKNRYHLFDAVTDLRARSHHDLIQQIRRGLVQGEFRLYYQPKVVLKTGCLAGVEALIRWQHPERGLLLPADFLGVIENTEMDILLGEWVIASALEQMSRWQRAGRQIEVSINISAYHLQSVDFVARFHAMVQRWDVQGLQIEVLETAALEDIAGISAIITACRAFGVGFALDDFGTGYSSLTYLSRLEVDTLKIDQSFVRDMLHEKGDLAIVQGIIALAHAFERGIVAEGVESEDHYQALLQIGCEVGQGNYISMPLQADMVLNFNL